VPLSCAVLAAVQSGAAADQATAAMACRCCPDGISRSTRQRCYPSDMDDRKWAVCAACSP
jgi:hypothetical protein